MSKFADRVKETSTSTGTGSITLAGAATQYEAFSANFDIGQRLDYAIVLQGGTEWETGRGYLSGATTLVRELVFESSNSDAAVNFSAGTKDVFCSFIAHYANAAPTHGKMMASRVGWDMP